MSLKSNSDLLVRYNARKIAAEKGEAQSKNLLTVIKTVMDDIGLRVDQLRKKYRHKEYQSYDAFKVEFEQLLKEHKVSNCTEFALLAYLKLRDQGKNPKLVQILVMNSDTGVVDLSRCHNTVVLGLAKEGNVNELSTWGNEAIVVDPWVGIARNSSKAFILINEKLNVDEKTEELIVSEIDFNQAIKISA